MGIPTAILFSCNGVMRARSDRLVDHDIGRLVIRVVSSSYFLRLQGLDDSPREGFRRHRVLAGDQVAVAHHEWPLVWAALEPAAQFAQPCF